MHPAHGLRTLMLESRDGVICFNIFRISGTLARSKNVKQGSNEKDLPALFQGLRLFTAPVYY